MFRIGDFAKFTRVSVKMLRHYDEIDLLKPSFVDPFTNYRYYTVDQLPRLNRIIVLKDLGFSLSQIGDMLDAELSDAEIRGMLRLRQAEIEARLAEEQQKHRLISERLRQLDDEREHPAYEIVVREIPAQWVASYRGWMEIGSADIPTYFDKVEKHVAQHRARAPLPPFLIYHAVDPEANRLDAELAIPIPAPIPEGEQIGVHQIPGCTEMACVVHTGRYSGLPYASAALIEWVELQGKPIAGPLREVYLRFRASEDAYALPEVYLAASGAELVTELQLPLLEPNN